MDVNMEEAQRSLIQSPQHDDQENSLSIGAKNKSGWRRTFDVAIIAAAFVVVGPILSPSFVGWRVMLIAVAVSWPVIVYRLLQMAKTGKIAPETGLDQQIQHDDHELGKDDESSGKRVGLWATVPPDIAATVGFNIVFLVLGGRGLMKFYELTNCNCPSSSLGYDCSPEECNNLSLPVWIGVFTAPQFILATLPNPNVMFGLLLLCYSSVTWAGSFMSHESEKVGSVSLNHLTRFQLLSACTGPSPSNENYESSQKLQNYFFVNLPLTVLSLIAVFCNFRNFKFQSTVRRRQDLPAGGLIFVMCVLQYLIISYWTDLDRFPDLPDSEGVLPFRSREYYTVATLVLLACVSRGCQTFSMDVYETLEMTALHVYDTLEMTAKAKLLPPWAGLARHLVRWSYVLLTGFVACILPFFTDWLVYLEIFVFGPTSYFLPFIISLKLDKPKPFSFSWSFNWVFISLGALGAIFILWTVSSAPELYFK